MDFLQLTIKKLEDEKMALMGNKEYNSIQIERCNRLIEYYCLLYSKVLESINLKRDSIDNYQLILDLKSKLRSPAWIEHLSFISDEHISLVIENLYEVIEALNIKGEDLKEKVYDIKKEKMEFESENDMLTQKLELIEMSIEDNVTNYSGKQKIIRRG